MVKRDDDPSEFERVARAGWAVTLRYRLLLLTMQPPRGPSKWPWVKAGGVTSAAMTIAAAVYNYGWP